MARRLYEIKLRTSIYPEFTEDGAIRMMYDANDIERTEFDVVPKEILDEEKTLKLFYAALALYKTEKFDSEEIECMVRALIVDMGVTHRVGDVCDCILTWCERFQDAEDDEISDWLLG